ncbi:MAG: hypothetical protein M3O23_12305 [Actinomycetota bacterium]|nr:hypothetical protein [Actinomycetota bacterium]
MPRRGQHDQSPGDARKPFSNQGGPAGRHAETHDVQREEATRPKAAEPEEDFSADLAPTTTSGGGHVDESLPAAGDKQLAADLDMLSSDELARLSILAVGAQLDQGATYVDLNDLARGPFKAIGSQEASADNSYVSKRDTDYELWNRLVGQGREPEIERPETAES